LKQHSKHSGVELSAQRTLENGNIENFIPHVLEIAFGTDRPTYTLIDLFYEKKQENQGKTIFKIPYYMAPIDVSIFPLMKKQDLLEKSIEIKKLIEKDFTIDYDINGSIGRRYLRSTSQGIPCAITIDYQTLEDNSVTIRDRDSEKQIRVPISKIKEEVFNKIKMD
jgi:glycyl-tRNA synthetase